METIYRIENENGQGCYYIGVAYCSTGDHWGPDYDRLLEKWWTGHYLSRSKLINWEDARRAWSCGFESMESLYNWFNENDLRIMAIDTESMKQTLYVTAYKVQKRYIKYGEEQIMFKRDKATICQRKKICALDGTLKEAI